LKPKFSRLSGILIVLALVLGACNTGEPVATGITGTSSPTAFENGTLTVFAAASLMDAFSEIGKAFEVSHPGTRVAYSFAGSQILRAQIEQGASADVFAPANENEMSTLITERLVQEGSAQTFLTNSLVVILPEDNPAGITSLEDLAKPGLKIVLAAQEVPAGKYARRILDNLNAKFGSSYKDRVLENVVSNETDVRQVVAKVQLGEADAGIVYASDAVAAGQLQKIDIPNEANIRATYPIASLAKSQKPELGKEFIDYVMSAEGQAILKKWGFTPVGP
jgi:molybdate transport system substrate-binding protein